MKKNIVLLVLGVGLIIQSCQNKTEDLTASQKENIINSAKKVVQKVFDASNNLDFKSGLDFYSDASDAYYVNNGTILSLDELKTSYDQIGPFVEVLNNSIGSWNSTFLNENTVAFTLPIQLKIKLKDKPEYNGQLVWSGIVQKKDGEWKIVQSHESWLNCAEVSAALN
ncbi:hypothetical protein GTQ40_15405 [Flavobacteriaceae bacterium R38]|nr:hypothetical protein [Flavobacteriaceae bacterium R38]